MDPLCLKSIVPEPSTIDLKKIGITKKRSAKVTLNGFCYITPFVILAYKALFSFQDQAVFFCASCLLISFHFPELYLHMTKVVLRI